LKQDMRDEATKLDKAIHQSEQLRTNLQEEITVKAHNTIQGIVDSKMVKVEQAIRDTLQKKGRTIVAHAKTEMVEQLKTYTQNVDKELEDKTEATFATAVSLLDQAVMKIGEEMDDALTDFNKTLTDTSERNRHIERIQKRVMNEIRPQVQELQDDFIKEISADIEMTVKNAQDDLHLNQGKLTKDTEERFKQHNETSKLNAEALHEDLRRQAETIEAELQERIQEFSARRQATKTQPTTPEPDRTRNSHPASPNHQPAWRTQPAPNTPEGEPPRNPYQRAPPVSPYHDVDIPSEDEWNKQVSRCKEKVTLKHSLPENAKDFDQDKAEAFYRQTECDFKGYPAVRLRKLDDLNRRGNTIPIEYEMGWPPEYVSEGSAILYEKLTEAIPHALTTLRNILITYQNDRNGHQALMSIMNSHPKWNLHGPRDLLRPRMQTSYTNIFNNNIISADDFVILK
jgi:hypothetical protein